MSDTSSRAGGRSPSNLVAGIEYNPIVGATSGHPTGFPIGTVVVPSSTIPGEIVPGIASDADTSLVLGIAAGAGVVGERVVIQTHGVLTLTTAQWDAVAGTTGGLATSDTYYLSLVSEGKLVSVKPTTPGDFVARVGLALSPRDLLIQLCATQAL